MKIYQKRQKGPERLTSARSPPTGITTGLIPARLQP
jgi:hypothetical protein